MTISGHFVNSSSGVRYYSCSITEQGKTYRVKYVPAANESDREAEHKVAKNLQQLIEIAKECRLGTKAGPAKLKIKGKQLIAIDKEGKQIHPLQHRKKEDIQSISNRIQKNIQHIHQEFKADQKFVLKPELKGKIKYHKEKKKVISQLVYQITGDNHPVAKKISSNKRVRQLMNYLISKEGVDKLSHKIRKIEDKPQNELEVIRALYRLDTTKNIEEIEFSKNILNDVKNQLKVGDLIFFQDIGTPKGVIDKSIVYSQKLAQKWTKGRLEPLSETYTHVGIYIGDGKLAEATPTKHKDEVRIISFKDAEMELMPGDRYQYLICRPKDEGIRTLAGTLAAKYAEEKTHIIKAWKKMKMPREAIKTKHSYSKIKATRSLFGSAKRERRMRQYLAKCMSELYLESKKPDSVEQTRSYFCSQFVMECLLKGNLMKQLNWISEKDIPRLGNNPKENLRVLEKWFIEYLKRNPELMKQLLINFNPDYVSPQKFRSIVNESPHLFQDILRIIPPI